MSRDRPAFRQITLHTYIIRNSSRFNVKGKRKGIPITGDECRRGMWMQRLTYSQPTALGRGRVASRTLGGLYHNGEAPGTHVYRRLSEHQEQSRHERVKKTLHPSEHPGSNSGRSARSQASCRLSYLAHSLTNQLTNWLSRNPDVHYRPYIIPPLVPIFSKSYPTSRITTHLPQIHFNIILPSTSRPP